MTFAIANFAPLGNTSKPLAGVGTATLTGAPSMWSYATADTAATVDTEGYFNDTAQMVNVGDLIQVVSGAGSGGTLVVTLMIVNAVNKATGVVDVSDGTAISATDSD